MLLTLAKCTKCGGKATGDSFEDARSKINHAVGLSRGIKCGDNYNRVEEIKDKVEAPKSTPKVDISDSVESDHQTITTDKSKKKSKNTF